MKRRSFVLSQRAERPYVQMLGGDMTHDAHHLTSVDPARTHIDACVRNALSAANTSTDEIAYLNAHGPGTQQCDTAEAELVDDVLHGKPRIYSIKQMVGHCQGPPQPSSSPPPHSAMHTEPCPRRRRSRPVIRGCWTDPHP